MEEGKKPTQPDMQRHLRSMVWGYSGYRLTLDMGEAHITLRYGGIRMVIVDYLGIEALAWRTREVWRSGYIVTERREHPVEEFAEVLMACKLNPNTALGSLTVTSCPVTWELFVVLLVYCVVYFPVAHKCFPLPLSPLDCSTQKLLNGEKSVHVTVTVVGCIFFSLPPLCHSRVGGGGRHCSVQKWIWHLVSGRMLLKS